MVRSAAPGPERRNSDPAIGQSYGDAAARTGSVRHFRRLHGNGAPMPHRRAGAPGASRGIVFAYVGIDNPYWFFGVRIHTIDMKIS
ncbi:MULTISPECIES: hypothetical protein [Cupriavidus]